MTDLFLSPLLLFFAIFALLVLMVEAGFRIARARALDTQEILREQIKEARDACVLLLSLLLGFTLAMALPRYDERKHLLTDEANDIGTTALRAQLLPEPYKTQIVHLITNYADSRLAYLEAGEQAASVEAALARTRELQNELWGATAGVSQAAPTPITSIFVQSLNGAIDSSEKQVATLENRIPPSVWIMITLIAMMTCFAAGLSARRRVLLSLTLMPLMTAVVMSLTADLDTPSRGFIQVGFGSMQRLVLALHAPPAQARP